MIYELQDANITLPDGSMPKYVGNKQFSSPKPQIKLDFCDDKRDTAHFYGFSVQGGLEQWEYKGQAIPGSLTMITYIVAFPDTRRTYEEFAKGASAGVASAPFGFYVKELPKNKRKIILDKTLDAKETSPHADHIDYGEFRLRIEHVEE